MKYAIRTLAFLIFIAGCVLAGMGTAYIVIGFTT